MFFNVRLKNVYYSEVPRTLESLTILKNASRIAVLPCLGTS
jgi:hypothetical protein